jgi:uncharacterized protein with NRDE domain
MCLVACRIAPGSRLPFVLASNRDEFFDRPAAPLAWWQPPQAAQPLLGGRDLGAGGGGTWLGLSRSGHLALVTNVRSPGAAATGLPSRGELVTAWLARPTLDATHLQSLAATPRNGFNLLAVSLRDGAAAWAGNRPPAARTIGAGTWGLSNAGLDTPWPKVRALKARLDDALRGEPAPEAVVASAFAALADRRPATDAELPGTGIPLERERQLSSAFIHIPAPVAYGTRCSTVVVAEQAAEGRLTVSVHERRFGRDGQVEGQAVERFDCLL